MHSFIANDMSLPETGDVLRISSETSIGIEEIRKIISFLSRKPTQGDRNIVAIEQAEKLTIPAQNALLKTLEEPPGNSNIYLITSFPNLLLPTILSRCHLIHKAPKSEISKPQLFPLIDKLLSEPDPFSRVKLMSEQEFTRDSALSFLGQTEAWIHNKILSQAAPPNHLYDQVLTTTKYLKSNCSVRLVMDHFALGVK